MIKKVKNILQAQITQGATPEKLAQSLTAGVLIGCFPLLGFTTGLAALAGFVFKLNHIVVQTTHYMLYPVQIILIPVYIKVVSLLVDVGDLPLRPDLIMEAFKKDWLGFIKTYSLVGLYAVLIWCLLSLVLAFILPKLFLPLVQRLSQLHKR